MWFDEEASTCRFVERVNLDVHAAGIVIAELDDDAGQAV